MSNDKVQSIMALKPCPFCGGEAKRSKTMDESLWSHATVPYHKVYCPTCEIGTEYLCEGYEPTADEAWNRREAIAAPGVAQGWKPLETAPRSGVILLAVKSGSDSRVFAAEMSNDHDIGGDVWNITTGWGGWTRLHKGWTPVAWQPRPAAPSTTEQHIQLHDPVTIKGGPAE